MYKMSCYLKPTGLGSLNTFAKIIIGIYAEDNKHDQLRTRYSNSTMSRVHGHIIMLFRVS